MEAYKQEALQLLETFPESDIKKGFQDLVNFVTDRKY
jgi:octaprenyl-diphosphate synthase